MLGDVREQLQQRHRRHDEVVEVERIGSLQAILVERVGLGDSFFDVVGRLRLGGLVVDELDEGHGQILSTKS